MTAAVLPAAGLSRRMGRPKLLLPFRGRPVVAGVVEALRRAGVGPIVLVTSAERTDIQEWARAAGLLLAVNPAPERGMLSSIQTGVAALGGGDDLARRREVLLVAPADLPGLQAATVTELLRRQAESAAPLAVPVAGGRRGHPLAIAPGLIPEIATLDLDVGLRQLLDRHAAEVLEVEVEDPGAVDDVDTPQDYERLLGPST
ncbi:MAG TPA: nucleotidyltransferase family protein [Thermoanaerobaculia bacterium]|nr:nucleotidyltransferase family protein [Thermoanaerobaculia bacterium]